MKNLRLIVFALLVACAVVAGFVLGFDSPSFAYNALMAVGVAVAPLFKRNREPGVFACDDDPVELLKEMGKTLKSTKESLEKKQADLDSAHKVVQEAITKGLRLDPETQTNVDKAIADANETSLLVKEQAQEIAELKKTAAANQAQPFVTLRGSIQKMLETSHKDALEKINDRSSGKLILKDVIDSGSVATGMKREPHIDSLVSMERMPLRILDLLNTVPVQTDAVKYGKQVLRTNAARIVAEGTAKPYSEYKWEEDDAIIQVVAHLAKVTLQALADAPRLAAEIESEMRYGLALAEEDEVLNGNGTTGHLSGLMLNATAYAVPAGMDTSGIVDPVDRLRVAILQIHLARAIPDGHVLNPINMAEIDLQRRDPDGSGGYLYSAPDESTGVTRLWRLPVVETPAMVVNKFLVGAFKYAASLYRRQGATVQISTENDDDFEKNLATMRCESRLGLGVRRSYALVKGDLKTGGS